MNFWLDVHIPFRIGVWLAEREHPAQTFRTCNLHEALDGDVLTALREPGHVIISKDKDFREICLRRGPPPQLLLVTCGNVSNRSLMELFEANFEEALQALVNGAPIVEPDEFIVSMVYSYHTHGHREQKAKL